MNLILNKEKEGFDIKVYNANEDENLKMYTVDKNLFKIKLMKRSKLIILKTKILIIIQLKKRIYIWKKFIQKKKNKSKKYIQEYIKIILYQKLKLQEYIKIILYLKLKLYYLINFCLIF